VEREKKGIIKKMSKDGDGDFLKEMAESAKGNRDPLIVERQAGLISFFEPLVGKGMEMFRLEKRESGEMVEKYYKINNFKSAIPSKSGTMVEISFETSEGIVNQSIRNDYLFSMTDHGNLSLYEITSKSGRVREQFAVKNN
jgi:hypothetical protein